MTIRGIVAGILIFCSFINSYSWAQSSAVVWRDWDSSLFSEAAQSKRLILLDLEAIWCHWCHVMEERTYSDAGVREILSARYITVRVDQAARPDLGVRYQDYGWPATIIFDAEGRELTKQAGFIEPREMEQLLRDLAEKPEPLETKTKSGKQSGISGVSATPDGSIPERVRTKLLEKHAVSLDQARGGLKTSHKYLDRDTFLWEFEMTKASSKEGARSNKFLQLSLDNNRALQDPAWGGVYQYSTYGDWDHPHFEKIMSSQVSNMRLYALGYAYFSNDEYQSVALRTVDYMKKFLFNQEAGAFYTSQDADLVQGEHSAEYFGLSDSERRAQGIPAVDKNMYARENGWAIQGVVAVAALTGDSAELEKLASRAAQWLLQHRQRDDGCFKHADNDQSGPFLGDSLAAAQAFIDLYALTAERAWLSAARKTADCIRATFSAQHKSGFPYAVQSIAPGLKPLSRIEENVAAARLFNLLNHYTGEEAYRQAARAALDYLGQPEIALKRLNESGILQADFEYRNPPLHLTVVGPKKEGDVGQAEAKALFMELKKYPALYKRIEWWDKSEGPLPHMDVEYPELDRPAAYVCSAKRCSTPILDPKKVRSVVDRITY